MNLPSASFTRAFSISAVVGALRDVFFAREKPKAQECVRPSEEELIQRADALFKQNRFVEVYELLDELRFSSNAEIHWRISRALFALSQSDSLPEGVSREMTGEAYHLIKLALNSNDNNANVHKWMAILLDCMSGYISTSTRTKALPEVRQHLLRAQELNPTDATTLYMLGHWCYQLASLTWFQRKLASIFYGSLPEASFEEAYRYFLKAEQLNPRFSIGNTYMLGKISYHLKQFYRAKYYLDITANLPHGSEKEKEYQEDARKISAELNCYDLLKTALFQESF